MRALTQVIQIAKLQDRLVERMKDRLFEICEWIYAERFAVVQYHVSLRSEYRFPAQQFLDDEGVSVQLTDRPSGNHSISLVYTEPWTEGDTWGLEIPFNHLEHPELVTELVTQREQARVLKAQTDAVAYKAEVERRLKALTEELGKL